MNHDVRTRDGDNTRERLRVESIDDNGLDACGPQGFRRAGRARCPDDVVARLEQQWNQPLPDRTRRSSNEYPHVSSMREAGIPALPIPE
jgi:hypothetical protein